MNGIRKKSILFFVSIIIVYIVVCIISHHIDISYHTNKKALHYISLDDLFQIWTAELAITAIIVAIITISLSTANKKLYGIQLSKIITSNSWFKLRLIFIFSIDMLTYFPVVKGNFYCTSCCYFASSLLAFWHAGESMYMLSYPEEYEKSAKEFYRNKIIDSKTDDIIKYLLKLLLLLYPKKYKSLIKKFYREKIISKRKNSCALIGENLYPYMCELIEEGKFSEYKRNFELLIKLFEISKGLKLSQFIEDKLYKALELTLKSDNLEFSSSLIKEFVKKFPVYKYPNMHPLKKNNFKFMQIAINFINKDLAKIKNLSDYESEFLQLCIELNYMEKLKNENLRSNSLPDIYIYFYNRTISLNVNKKFRKKVIDFISGPVFSSRGSLISNYTNFILEIFYNVIYNVDEENFESLLKKLASLKEFISQKTFLEIIVKVSIYIYSLYLEPGEWFLESEELSNKGKKDILKKIVNKVIEIDNDKSRSFSELLNDTIQANITDFISLKEKLSSDEAKEFYTYFLITYNKSQKDLNKHLPDLAELDIRILKRNYQALLDLFSISLDKKEKKKKILDLFIRITERHIVLL